MRLYGLIGYPLDHSFSGKFFEEKFAREGLSDCTYRLFPMKSISELPQLLKEYPFLKGLNVTIPHKRSVLGYLDSTRFLPPGLAACNCIKIENSKLTGYNTDHSAFEKSLLPLLKENHRRALVLGQGGSAEAVEVVLKRLNIDCSIVSRSHHDRARFTYNELGEKQILDHLLIINTTPLGMYPQTNFCPDIPYQFITKDHLLFDLVYNPSKTLFLQKGEQVGARVKNGEEMLKFQAEESWQIWKRLSGE